MRKYESRFSAYGEMRDRIAKREEKEKKKVKSKVPYKYLMFVYGV